MHPRAYPPARVRPDAVSLPSAAAPWPDYRHHNAPVTAARARGLALHAPPAPRRASCPASSTAAAASRSPSRSTRASCATRSPTPARSSSSRRRRQATPVVLKDVQRHPVRGETMHVDLLRVASTRRSSDRHARAHRRRGRARRRTRAACSSRSRASSTSRRCPGDIPDVDRRTTCPAWRSTTRVTLVGGHGARRASRCSTTPTRRRSPRSPRRARAGRGRDRDRDRARRRGRRAGRGRGRRGRGDAGDGRATADSDDAPEALRRLRAGRLADRRARQPRARATPTRPHNVGFQVADELAARWDLPQAEEEVRRLLTEGRTGPGGPRVAVLLPQTYMNESGRSVGPARGALKLDARPRARRARRDRPAVRRHPLAPRRRPRRPQRPQVAQARARRRRTSRACASASAGPDSTDPEHRLRPRARQVAPARRRGRRARRRARPTRPSGSCSARGAVNPRGTVGGEYDRFGGSDIART